MTYNQIRWIKRILALALVLFGSLVSHQLFVSVNRETVSLDVPVLAEPEDVLARQVELTRLDSEGEKEFVLRAAEKIGGSEEIQVFKDVEIEFAADQGRLPLLVTADICRYDAENAAAHLEGNVVIQDDESLRIETSVLDWQRRRRRVWTEETVRFWREGLEGTSGGLEYRVQTASYELKKGVTVRFGKQGELPTEVVSQTALFQSQKSFVRFVDDVVVNQGDHWLYCNDLQVFLTEEDNQVEHLEAYENVELILKTSPVTPEAVDDAPSSARASEPASDKTSGKRLVREPGTKHLFTDNLEVLFRKGGKNLERMRALKGGKLVMESPPQPDGQRGRLRELEGNILTFDFDEQGRLAELRGRGRNVILTLKPAEGVEEEDKRVITRRLEAIFDPETGDLTEARCSNGVEFYQGDLRAEAEEGVYMADGELMTLSESPRLWDSDAELVAETIRIELASGNLEAEGRVRTTLSQGVSGGSTPLFPASGNEPVYFVGEHLQYMKETDIATYTGGARCFQKDNRIEAERIVLHQGKGELEATGSVRTLFFQPQADGEGAQQTITRAGEFVYRSSDETMMYLQDVVMQSEEISLKGSKVDVRLEPNAGSVAEIHAVGAVEIQTADGKAQGNDAKYLPESGKVHVTGDKARMQNGDKLTEGNELTFFLSGDTIFVDGRELSRTKTIYTSKPRPF